MKTYLHIALLSAQFLMGGVWQQAMAQPSDRLADEPSVALTSEQVVNKLVQRNLERGQALAADSALGGFLRETDVYGRL